MKNGGFKKLAFAVIAGASIFLASCAGSTSTPTASLGGSNMPVSGSAAGETTQGENPKLEKCDKPLGTIAIYEDLSLPWYVYLRRDYKVERLAPMLRLMIQQSNCFVVVDRGEAFRTGMRMERELEMSGELRSNSNFGKGQMVAADFTLTPAVNFSEKTGGFTGGIGSLLPGGLGGLLAKLNIKEASTTLLLTENRSGVQVAASEGSAKGYNIFGAGAVVGGGLGIVGYGWGDTPESKILLTAFLDAYNKMVQAAKNYKMQTVEGGLGTGKGPIQVQGAQETTNTTTTDTTSNKTKKIRKK
jgi:hypothetical protein